MLKIINELLAAGVRKIDEVYNHCKISYINLADSQRPRNINTMDDYREFVNENNDTI